MHRNGDGSVTFERREVRLVRAALFTIEHYANTVWDDNEVHAVSGYPATSFGSARRALDGLNTPEDQRAETVDRVRVNLDLFEARDDSDLLHERVRRALRATVDEALDLGVPVSERLLRLRGSD